MQNLQVALLVVLALLVTDVFADDGLKPRKHKKYRNRHPFHNLDLSASEETEYLKKVDTKSDGPLSPLAEADDVLDNRLPSPDPCLEHHCGAGMICQRDEENQPRCVCIDSCPEETESRRKVCSNHNETWPSDCSIYQQRCWCRHGDERCKGEQYKHIHIEYYGTCREIKECTEGEMSDFPRRMRDWLFNVMQDLADRDELSPHYMEMQRDAESNLTRRWTNAAMWKFCDLDGHPPDRYVSRHELFPIRAPLMSLEHCISPFLNSCDANDDHKITIKEWAKCLELEEDDIEAKCDEIGKVEEGDE